MTVPERRVRRSGRGRPFDLRATALFFTLLALVLVVLSCTARAALAAAERRPAWAAVLCMVGAAAAALAVRRRRRRGHLARRTARRAAAALEEATRTALDALETPPGPALAAVPAQAGSGRPPVDPGAVAPAGPVADVAPTAGQVAAGEAAVVTEVTVVDGEAEVVDEVTVVDYDVLGPDEFEQAVAALCERDGCRGVEVAGGAGDLGADVLALAPDGRRLVVQCKRYRATNRVGSEDLQRFGGTCYTVHEADVAVFVTTSDFTAPALEYAQTCGIVCVDGQDLRAWSEGTGPVPWATVSAGPRPAWPSPGARGR
ncbi:restriction endonuclease [Streptomyces sp. NPDC018610]|uniref:restriction endonuclease n=1 Tax=Streptomyces sp. NPDC018610 TaxID=3365049 RepID=UPI00379BC296